MKKLLVVLLTMFLVLSLAACGGSDNGSNDGEEGIRIALLIPYRGDQSYFDTVAKGADALNADKTNGITVDLFEADTKGAAEAENWANWFANVCEDGKYDLVVAGNNTYEHFLWEACAKYPEQKFMNFDTSILPEGGVPANCYAVNYALDDLGYVVGALSGALTKTGTVGVVVGMDNQAMNQFISGYCQVLTDMDVKYVIDYPGSFTDTALGKEHTENMIKKGADVIWQVAGGLGNGVIEACSNHDDVWVIGVDQDQYGQFKSSQPTWANSIITSALKNAGVVLSTVAGWVKDGSIDAKMGTLEQWGISMDGVGLAENDFYLSNVSEEVRKNIEDVLASAASGTIEIKDTMEMKDYENEWPAVRDANRLQ